MLRAAAAGVQSRELAHSPARSSRSRAAAMQHRDQRGAAFGEASSADSERASAEYGSTRGAGPISRRGCAAKRADPPRSGALDQTQRTVPIDPAIGNDSSNRKTTRSRLADETAEGSQRQSPFSLFSDTDCPLFAVHFTPFELKKRHDPASAPPRRAPFRRSSESAKHSRSCVGTSR